MRGWSSTFTGLIAGLAPVAAAAQQPVTAFINVAVIPMDHERVLTGYTALVHGDRITALGPSGKVPVPAKAVHIDGRGKFLIPGLADMHAHLPGGDEERTLFLDLAHGVTTARSMFEAPMDVVRRTRTGELLGPRIYNSKMNPPVSQIAEFKASGYDFFKFYNYPGDRFEAAVAEARRVGIPIAGHVSSDVGLLRTLQAGYASIEHLSGYLDYLTGLTVESPKPDSSALRQALAHVDESKIRTIVAATKQAGVWVCPTLAVWKSRSFDSATLAQRPEMRFMNAPSIWWSDEEIRVSHRLQYELKRRLIKPLHDGGVGLLLGSDAFLGFLVPGFAIAQELEELVAAGLTPYEALVTGTRNPAVFFGTLDSTGTVTVGKRADLVLLAGNPLLDIRHVAHPAGVMVGGRWLSRDELDARLAALE